MSSLDIEYNEVEDTRKKKFHNEKHIHLAYAKFLRELEEHIFENYNMDYIPNDLLQALMARLERVPMNKFDLVKFEKVFDRDTRDLNKELFLYNKKQSEKKTLFQQLGID